MPKQISTPYGDHVPQDMQPDELARISSYTTGIIKLTSWTPANGLPSGWVQLNRTSAWTPINAGPILPLRSYESFPTLSTATPKWKMPDSTMKIGTPFTQILKLIPPRDGSTLTTCLTAVTSTLQMLTRHLLTINSTPTYRPLISLCRSQRLAS